MNMSRTVLLTLLGASISLVITFDSALAQSTKAPAVPQPPEANAPAVQATILADVNLVDLKYKEKDGVYTGSYNLIGKMGEQNGIGIGIVVYDEKNTIVAVQTLMNNVSIREGEIRPYTFTYTLPKTLSGKVKVVIRAQTDGGLPLGFGSLGEKILGTTKKSSVLASCAVTVESFAEITCTSPEKTLVTFSYRPNSLFSSSTFEQTRILEKGKRFVINPQLEPGKYYAVLSSIVTGDQKILPVRVNGTYGKFVSMVVDDTKPGELTVTSALKISKDLPTVRVTATLSDSQGKECGKAFEDVQATRPLSLLHLATRCKSGTVVTTITDVKGNILSSKKESFAVTNIKDMGSKTPLLYGMNILELTVIGLVIVVLLSAIFLVVRKVGPVPPKNKH